MALRRLHAHPSAPHYSHQLAAPTGFPWVRRCREALTMLFRVILGPIFYQILILFLNPQNRGFAIPSHTFRYSGITKALFLGPLFNHFFDPILGPPFEEPFGPPWPPKVPTLPPHVDFGVILGPPLDPKWDLGAPTGGQRGKKGWSFELGSRSRLRLGSALWSKGFQRAIPIDCGAPLGDEGSLLGLLG